MRKLISFLSVLLLFVFSCTDVDIEYPIDIEYSFENGGVSPLIVKFKMKTDKELRYARWIIHDTYEYMGDSADILFYKPGRYSVKLLAVDVDAERYRGEIAVDIPNVASKLLIKGFYIEDKSGLNFDRDSVVVSVSHYNKNDNPSFYRTYATSDFLSQDTTYFQEPISLNAFRSNDYTDLQDSSVEFSLGTTLFTHKFYYRAEFFMIEAYYLHRFVSPYQIGKDGFWGQQNRVTLLVEWK